MRFLRCFVFEENRLSCSRSILICWCFQSLVRRKYIGVFSVLAACLILEVDKFHVFFLGVLFRILSS
ncbi:hypothetical protein RchiOBHm_Chr1g0370591 [Rosa chinensis]|uniref:Uncharacterized protein n=1 Tax=Rosa chinensis TaxID=74649 RepID=A0A2P6SLB1_ROSCH|nr:hypothetical protein RchiOBHm_Chr1g0370591 [Rosa chinensis]